ncbi:KH domain protein [Cooperia oncophora]
MKELAEDGYSGVEVRRTPARAEVIIMATRTQSVLGERGRRIKELTSVVQKRFGFEEGSVEENAHLALNGLGASHQNAPPHWYSGGVPEYGYIMHTCGSSFVPSLEIYVIT